MSLIRNASTGALAALLLGSAACARNSQMSSAGDVLPAYDEYANSALLHVTSNYLGDVQVFTVAQGSRDYLGVVSSIAPSNLVLDPALVPNANIYVLLRSSDGDQKTLGPISVRKGSVVDIKIPATVRGSLYSMR
jgi:hypothetical protein